jgi:hypothetical protein
MSIISFPYDSQATQLPHARVHLARAHFRIANCQLNNLYVAVDFDQGGPFPFQNTVLQENLLPLLCRALQVRTTSVDIAVQQLKYTAIPSLLLSAQLSPASPSVTHPMRVRVFFSDLILMNHFVLAPNCQGVFGRRDFPSSAVSSSTMTEFRVDWP